MNSVQQILTELEKKGTESTRKTFARHGITGNTYGVKIGDLKVIAKQIKGNQTLAFKLFETGNYDAMYLAGMVADGSQMTKKQVEDWAKNANWGTVSEYTIPWIATENRNARSLANKWIKSKNESLASSGWCTYVGILATTPDEELDLDEISELLDRVVDQIDAAPDRVRYTMNGFVIGVGAYVKPLLKQAKRVAKTIGEVSVDMGQTACKVPVALPYIEKIEKSGRVGKKRKTIRC